MNYYSGLQIEPKQIKWLEKKIGLTLNPDQINQRLLKFLKMKEVEPDTDLYLTSLQRLAKQTDTDLHFLIGYLFRFCFDQLVEEARWLIMVGCGDCENCGASDSFEAMDDYDDFDQQIEKCSVCDHAQVEGGHAPYYI